MLIKMCEVNEWEVKNPKKKSFLPTSLKLQNEYLKWEQKFYRVKSRVNGYFAIPFDPFFKRDFKLTIGYEFYTRVYKSAGLKYSNSFMVCKDRIVIHTFSSLKNPIISIMYARKLKTEITNTNDYKVKNLKPQSIPRYHGNGVKRNVNVKLLTGKYSEGCQGDHHVLEAYSSKMGKGEIVLCDSIFFYREYNKPDLAVAIVLYDSLNNKNIVKYLGQSNDKFIQKCHKKVHKILFGVETKIQQVIKNKLGIF